MLNVDNDAKSSDIVQCFHITNLLHSPNQSFNKATLSGSTRDGDIGMAMSQADSPCNQQVGPQNELV